MSSDGAFTHPTTLARPVEWFESGDPAPGIQQGYFSGGDFVFMQQLGWFRMEDTCGACLSKGSIDIWTAAADYPAESEMLSINDRLVWVFHPDDDIPQDLLDSKADPSIWQAKLWIDAAHRLRNAEGQSLFLDGQPLPAAIDEPMSAALSLLGLSLLGGIRRHAGRLADGKV